MASTGERTARRGPTGSAVSVFTTSGCCFVAHVFLERVFPAAPRRRVGRGLRRVDPQTTSSSPRPSPPSDGGEECLGSALHRAGTVQQDLRLACPCPAKPAKTSHPARAGALAGPRDTCPTLGRSGSLRQCASGFWRSNLSTNLPSPAPSPPPRGERDGVRSRSQVRGPNGMRKNDGATMKPAGRAGCTSAAGGARRGERSAPRRAAISKPTMSRTGAPMLRARPGSALARSFSIRCFGWR